MCAVGVGKALIFKITRYKTHDFAEIVKSFEFLNNMLKYIYKKTVLLSNLPR